MQLKYTLFSSISMLAFSSLSVFSQTEKMNVLFLMADDMRPELGCYGVKEVKTPNIDRFAASGLLFQNAYCNIPVSGASRASLLTGVYPHYPDRFVNYSAYASKDCPTAIPISRWFTSHGYYTISNGKVLHHLSDHANSCRITGRSGRGRPLGLYQQQGIPARLPPSMSLVRESPMRSSSSRS